ncbi:MAG: phospholipase [Chloroflexi bacterium]|nr:phospholipase [Chloroflexota bacterium]
MTPLKYLLYPPQAEAFAPYPLVIFLHGVGERGENLELVKKWALPRYMETGEVKLPAYIVAPQCPADVRWKGVLTELDALLDDLLEKYPLDRARVYLTGFSMGSRGVWLWATHRPERLAALMPVGGSGPHPTDEVSAADLAVLRCKPVWMVHGAADEVVAVSGVDQHFATLAALNPTIGYTRYPDANHGETADRAFRDTTILNWLLAQKLEK